MPPSAAPEWLRTGWIFERSATSAPATCDHLLMAVSVLIVDDHPAFRASVRAMLELDGFEVVGEAEDGTSGIEQAGALEPDVVLLDVALPDMSGFDVAEQLAPATK